MRSKFLTALLFSALSAAYLGGVKTGAEEVNSANGCYFAKTVSPDTVMIAVYPYSDNEDADVYELSKNYAEDIGAGKIKSIIFRRDGKKIGETPAYINFFYDSKLSAGKEYEYTAELVYKNGGSHTVGTGITHKINGNEDFLCRRAVNVKEGFKSLRLTASGMTEDDYKTLKKVKSIDELTVILDYGKDFDFSFLSECEIKTLNISGWDGKKHSLDGISPAGKLEKINIKGGKYTDMSFLPGNKTLKELNIYSAAFDSLKGLDGASGIEKIHIHGDVSVRNKKANFGKLKGLKDICIYSSDISVSAKELSQMVSLKKADLSGMVIDKNTVLPKSLESLRLTDSVIKSHKPFAALPCLKIDEATKDSTDSKIFDKLSKDCVVIVEGDEEIFCGGVFFSSGDPDYDGIENEYGSSNDVCLTDPDDFDPDYDGDGLGDGWEVRNGYSCDSFSTFGDGICDADRDLDGDGLTAIEEYRLHTDDSTVSETDLNCGRVSYYQQSYYNMFSIWGDYGSPVKGFGDGSPYDCDNDGLSDGDEVNVYGTDPINGDSDGDGIPDGDEVTLGTDPKVYDKKYFDTEFSGSLHFWGETYGDHVKKEMRSPVNISVKGKVKGIGEKRFEARSLYRYSQENDLTAAMIYFSADSRNVTVSVYCKPDEFVFYSGKYPVKKIRNVKYNGKKGCCEIKLSGSEYLYIVPTETKKTFEKYDYSTAEYTDKTFTLSGNTGH